jgi:hypothetical protein
VQSARRNQVGGGKRGKGVIIERRVHHRELIELLKFELLVKAALVA